MTNTRLDELGPVDYVVVEFPASAKDFTGEMAAELLKLVDAGTIRVIDVLILDKSEDGSVEATELSDIEQLGEMQSIEAELAELLAADDVDHLAASMEPGIAFRPRDQLFAVTDAAIERDPEFIADILRSPMGGRP